MRSKDDDGKSEARHRPDEVFLTVFKNAMKQVHWSLGMLLLSFTLYLPTRKREWNWLQEGTDWLTENQSTSFWSFYLCGPPAAVVGSLFLFIMQCNVMHSAYVLLTQNTKGVVILQQCRAFHGLLSTRSSRNKRNNNLIFVCFSINTNTLLLL